MSKKLFDIETICFDVKRLPSRHRSLPFLINLKLPNVSYTRQGKVQQEAARQRKARLWKAREGKARQCEVGRDEARQDEAR